MLKMLEHGSQHYFTFAAVKSGFPTFSTCTFRPLAKNLKYTYNDTVACLRSPSYFIPLITSDILHTKTPSLRVI